MSCGDCDQCGCHSVVNPYYGGRCPQCRCWIAPTMQPDRVPGPARLPVASKPAPTAKPKAA